VGNAEFCFGICSPDKGVVLCLINFGIQMGSYVDDQRSVEAIGKIMDKFYNIALLWKSNGACDYNVDGPGMDSAELLYKNRSESCLKDARFVEDYLYRLKCIEEDIEDRIGHEGYFDGVFKFLFFQHACFVGTLKTSQTCFRR